MDKLLRIIKKIIPGSIFRAFSPAYHFLFNALAALVYRWPSENLIVIGITGTTGKTTSVYMIAKMLEGAGFKTGYTSTAMFNDGEREWLNDKKMTMIGRFFTQKIMRDMVKNGCRFAIIETTSEGIVQFRHRFINYDTIIFTGLYPEHIESHGSFEKYKEAKGRLFDHLKRCRTKYCDDKNKIKLGISNFKKIGFKRIKKTTIVNGDDEHAGYFLGFWAEKKIIFSSNNKIAEELSGNFEIFNFRVPVATVEGISFAVADDEINLKLPGEFNASNAMTAVCVGLSYDFKFFVIKSGLEKIKCVPGRFEKIEEDQDFTVIVDYAYEPKAVIKLYETISSIPHKNIIHVLGSAGGGRDAARRPILGEIAGKRANYIIITNEDPYDEDPGVIIKQVATGAIRVGKTENKNIFNILDRRKAIEKAFMLAKKGDIVLITGKGNEQAICIADGGKIEWDDRKTARELLNNRKIS